MNPLFVEALRRQWQLLGALSLFLVFVLVHVTMFTPTVRRYETALKEAVALGMPLDPNQMPRSLPPRVFALLAENALQPAAAAERGSSGALTSSLMEDMNALTAKHGMQLAATDPGPLTQLPNSVQVRAHLRIRCRYDAFVGLLDDMAKGGSLIAVERFALTPADNGTETLELWVSRYILKQSGGSK
jgi:hypothetical protein